MSLEQLLLNIELLTLNVAFASVAISVTAFIVAFLGRNGSLPLRYAICWVAVCVMVISPTILLVAGSFQIGLVRVPMMEKSKLAMVTETRADLTGVARNSDAFDGIAKSAEGQADRSVANGNTFDDSNTIDQSGELGSKSVAAFASVAESAPETNSGSVATNSPSRYLVLVLAILWVGVSLCLFARLVNGMYVVRKLRKALIQPEDSRLLHAAQKAQQSFMKLKSVTLLESSFVSIPLAIGWFRPIVVMPQNISQRLNDSELVSVLAHEMAHICRKDSFSALLQRLSTVLFWWNPLLHVLSRRMDRFRELICDDWVVRKSGTGEALAEAVVKIAEWNESPCHPIPMSIALFESRNDIEARLSRLLNDDAHRVTSLPLRSWLSIGGFGILLSCSQCIPVFVIQVIQPFTAAAAPQNPTPVVQQEPANRPIQAINEARQSVQDDEPLPRNALLRIGSSRFQHTSHIYALKYSPDGNHLATACFDKYVRLWDAKTGKLVRTFADPDGIESRSIAFAHDGSTIGAITNVGRIHLWSVESGESLLDRPIHDPGEGRHSIVFLPKSTKIATTSPGKIHIRDILTASNSNSTIQSLEYENTENTRGFTGFAFACSPKGTQFAIATFRDIQLMDVVDPSKNTVIKNACSGEMTSLEFTPDGQFLLSSGISDPIRIRSEIAGEMRNSRKPEISLWNIQDQTRVVDYKVDQDDLGTTKIALSPDGNRFVTLIRGALRIRDTKTGLQTSQPIILRSKSLSTTEALAFSPDGVHLAVVSPATRVRILNLQTGIEEVELGEKHSGPVRNVAFSRDGKQIASIDESDGVKFWDRSTGKLVHDLVLADSPMETTFKMASLQFSPDGKKVAASSSRMGYDQNIFLTTWSTETGRILETIEAPKSGMNTSFDLARRSMILWSGGITNSFDLERAARGVFRIAYVAPDSLIREPNRDGIPSAGVVASYMDYDQMKLRYLDEKGTLYTWSLNDDKVEKTQLITTTQGIQSALFSRDGKTLLVQGWRSNVIYLCNPESGREYLRIIHDNTPGSHLALSPDSTKLASAPMELWRTKQNYDKNVIIWDTRTSQILRELRLPGANATSVAFSSDGRELVTGHGDGTILVWKVD